MKIRDGHIIVFEEVDIRWIADCMAAYLVRSQQLKNAGLVQRHPVDRALHWRLNNLQDLPAPKRKDRDRLAELLVQVMGKLRFDYVSGELVSQKAPLRNLLANAVIKNKFGDLGALLDDAITKMESLARGRGAVHSSSDALKQDVVALAVFVFAEFMVQNRPKTVGYQLASPGAV